jgi:uncharacterized protein
MTAPVPLTYPLAGLLAEPPGSVRRFDILGATVRLAEDMRLTEPLEGRLRVTRTNRGVLVNASLDTSIAASCSRCLRDIDVAIHVDIEEEALPSVDVTSGHPIDMSAEPDVARLMGHHELDLGALAADAISLAEPIAPLCEEACPGLCPTCGERLGPGHETHEVDEVDPRLAALRSFRVDEDRESE